MKHPGCPKSFFQDVGEGISDFMVVSGSNGVDDQLYCWAIAISDHFDMNFGTSAVKVQFILSLLIEGFAASIRNFIENAFTCMV